MRSDFEAELNKIQRQRDRLSAKYTAEVEELRANLTAAEHKVAEAEGNLVFLPTIDFTVTYIFRGGSAGGNSC